jgi:hypothetical protein
MLPEASSTVLLGSIAKLFFMSAMGYFAVRFSLLSKNHYRGPLQMYNRDLAKNN